LKLRGSNAADVRRIVPPLLGRVPAFEDDDGGPARQQVGLLDRGECQLDLGELLIVGGGLEP